MIALLAIQNALAGDIVVQAPIAGVTVYGDRARVVRQVTVDVPQGRSELVFEGLPAGLVAQSLSAEGEGTAEAALTGLESRVVHGVEDRDARLAKLVDERHRLDDEARVHQDKIDRLAKDLELLRALGPVAPTSQVDRTFLASDAAQTLAALTKQTGDRIAEALHEQRVEEHALRDLLQRIERNQRDQQMLSGDTRDAMRVAVGVDAGRSGKVTVRLHYIVGGATWSPHYDARFAPETGKVELDVSGEVHQATGEDWTDVKLVLSTARPEQGTAPPALQPFVLQAGAPSYHGTQAAVGASAFELATALPEDVPADGTVRRVFLEATTLDPELVYRVVPRALEGAWLVARAKNPLAYALPAGPVSAYVGSTYVGDGALGIVAPSEPVELSFGVDDRVKVERKRLETQTADAKPLGNRERARYAFETKVTNRTGKEVHVYVTEQVPASRDASYVVDAKTSPAVDVGATGVFTWDAKIAADKTAAFRVDYEVSWPEGLPPILLD